MTALAIALYVLGAAGTLPTLRSLLRDDAVRVRFAPSTIAIGCTVFVVTWPLYTVAGVVRLTWRWGRR